MQGLLKLFLLAGLFTISLAQCSGSFTDSANNVTIKWTVIDNNTVNFIYTAPATSTQYTALAFSNQLITSVGNLANVDAVYAGDNGADSFVQDRWVPSAFSNQLDTVQNLEDTNATLSNGSLTVNFTRPIISPDKTQDLDLNICKYVIYVFNGAVIGSSFSSPTGFGIPTGFGFLLTQLCFQNCQDDDPSPSATIPFSTGTMSTTTISTTSVQSSSSISSGSTSVSATPIATSTPTATATPTPTSTPSGASAEMFASVLLIMIAVTIVLYV